MNAPFKPEAPAKTLEQLALEAVGTSVILRAWEPWLGEDDYARRDDAALDARKAFMDALLVQTGISPILWDTLQREGII